MKLQMLILLRGLFLCNILVQCRYMNMYNDRIPWVEAQRRCISLGGHLANYMEIQPFLEDIAEICSPPASFWLGNFTISTPILQFEGYVNDTAVLSVANRSQVFNCSSLEQCAIMCGKYPSFTVSDESCVCLTDVQVKNISGRSQYSTTPKQRARALIYKYYDKKVNSTEKCVLEFCKASVSEDVKSSSPEVERCSFPVEVNTICRDSLTTEERRKLTVMRKSWQEAVNFCQNGSHGGLIGKLSIDNCRKLRLVYGDSVMNTYMWTHIKSYHKSFSAIEYQLFSADISLPSALQFSWLEYLDFSVSSSSYSAVNRFGYFCITDKMLQNTSSSCDLDLTVLGSPPRPPVLRTDDLKVSDAGTEWKTVIIVTSVIIFIVIICLVIKLIVYSRRSKSDRKEKDRIKVAANGYPADDADDFSDDTRLMEVDTSNKANDTMNSILIEMKTLNDSKS